MRLHNSFKSLSVGDTFDFVAPNSTFNSFYDRCRKVSARQYVSLKTGDTYTIGSVMAAVWHVERQS